MRWFYSLSVLLAVLPNGQSTNSFCDYYESKAENISPACLKQIHTVCNNSTLSWLMFDASSKLLIPGMSYSNVIDYGNFPECLSIAHEDQDGRIMGKYCVASVIIVNILMMTSDVELILRQYGLDVTSGSIHKVSMDTFLQMGPQLRDVLLPSIPFVLSKYSSCVPDACAPSEVGSFYLFDRLKIANQSLVMYVDNLYPGVIECETVESNTDFEWGDILFITFLALILLIMIASTIYDALCQNFGTKPYHELFIAFSVLHNGKKLLHISTNTTEQIQVFNGMRFISMMWVVAFHAVAPFQAGIVALENYPEVQEWDQHWTARYILSALLAVDTFFFISGFLLAFSYLKSHLEESPLKQLRGVPKMYLHRYLRLTPAVGAMYLVMITIYRFLGSGPMWSTIANMMKDTCKKQWWKFFLYIQNYTDPDEMCVNPMWYLSADMQMFILAPIVLIPTATFIKKRFKQVIWGLVGLTFLSVLIPMLVRYFVDEAAGNIYTSHERFNNFLIGFIFGAFMRMKRNHKFIFGPVVNVLLWVVTIVVSLAFNIYWHDVLNNYELLKYTLFMGFYRPVWCLCLVFMVYSCYHNQGGIIQWFLSRPGFQILGRLSYCMYVLHVTVEMYAAGILKTSVYFSNYLLFYNWCGHIIVTMMVAVVWVLAFEYPMLTIDKYILGQGTKSAPKTK